MFTGLIQDAGRLRRLEMHQGDGRLSIDFVRLDSKQIRLGDSIAVNGVCLTAVVLNDQGFSVDISAETLSCTTLGMLQPGHRVNLELALLPTTRLGGHLVSGHVDGIGEIVSQRQVARSMRFEVRPPAALMRYIVEKGSICIDGISLTINTITTDRFTINIVPHTLSSTTLQDVTSGHRVNLEVDLIARYVERLLSVDDTSTIDRTFLSRYGFDVISK